MRNPSIPLQTLLCLLSVHAWEYNIVPLSRDKSAARWEYVQVRCRRCHRLNPGKSRVQNWSDND